MELYVQSNDQHGEPLIDLIQCEYGVFEEDLYTSGDATRLLEDIMRSGWDDDFGESLVDAHELYCPRVSLWYHTTRAAEFEEFCKIVKNNSAEELNLHELFEEELARTESELTQDTAIYRARIGFVDDRQQGAKPFKGQDIGAPPFDKAKAARSNAEGEVVLYVADQEDTAIAEVRPWRGLLVSVAEIRALRKLRLVDLSKFPPLVNPFTDEYPQYESELVELLVAFGMELSRPLRQTDDVRDYLPCQKLVRRIRESGKYDGMRYPSAMNPGGTNVVIFDPKLVSVGPSKLVQVSDVRIFYGAPEDD